jgi:hypothetical protein
MSKHLSIILTFSSLVFAACTNDAPADTTPDLSPEARMELAALGITSITQLGETFQLADRDGHEIGSVSVSGAELEAHLHGDRVHSQTTASSITVECNGVGASLPRDGVSPTSVTGALEPCTDALRVAEILTGNTGAITGQGLARGCLFLGVNEYCLGSTLIKNFDSLCYDAIGWERIETVAYQYPGAIACQ